MYNLEQERRAQMKEICWDTLPQTFKDAVQVTRALRV